MTRRDRDFFSSESQYRDETETFFFLVSMSRRDRDFFPPESQCRDETETFFSESQCRDETETVLESQYRDETETFIQDLIIEFLCKKFPFFPYRKNVTLSCGSIL